MVTEGRVVGCNGVDHSSTSCLDGPVAFAWGEARGEGMGTGQAMWATKPWVTKQVGPDQIKTGCVPHDPTAFIPQVDDVDDL